MRDFYYLGKSTIVAKQSMQHLMHECCVSSRKLFAELHIFDFVDQAILLHIDMHPFMAYGVIHFNISAMHEYNSTGVFPCHFL